MQELIKIEKRVIGAEDTNSVDARELHTALAIKKAFTHWIDTQIQRAGLQRNVDYIIGEAKSAGGRPQKNYYLTTDASKHIAMMSQGVKAKEVRDYFIAVEKEYQAQRTSPNEVLSQIAPVLQNIVQMMQMMMENQNKMMEMILKQDKKQIPNALTPAQLDAIKMAVMKAAKPLQDVHDFSWGRAIKEVYSELNGRMGVFTYYQIAPHDFDEALALLKRMKIQKEEEFATKKSVQTNIYLDFSMPMC